MEIDETLENLTEVCKTIAEKENNKENGYDCNCNWDCEKIWKTLKSAMCWVFHCNEDDREEQKEMQSEREQNWIKILSNRLYIALEWLWRNNPKSQYKKGNKTQRKQVCRCH